MGSSPSLKYEWDNLELQNDHAFSIYRDFCSYSLSVLVMNLQAGNEYLGEQMSSTII